MNSNNENTNSNQWLEKHLSWSDFFYLFSASFSSSSVKSSVLLLIAMCFAVIQRPPFIMMIAVKKFDANPAHVFQPIQVWLIGPWRACTSLELSSEPFFSVNIMIDVNYWFTFLCSLVVLFFSVMHILAEVIHDLSSCGQPHERRETSYGRSSGDPPPLPPLRNVTHFYRLCRGPWGIFIL